MNNINLTEALYGVTNSSPIINQPKVTARNFIKEFIDLENRDEHYVSDLLTIKRWCMNTYDKPDTSYKNKHYLYSVIKEVDRLIMIKDIT